ncbi:hypothetical protein HK102_012619 [Quaeritorhiza haematococci]|nr:hypothetical protein HK102_012619 [Quaeritorhiza haematococci]
MTDQTKDLSARTVKDLREELKTRKLPQSGTKAELIKRLQKAIDDEKANGGNTAPMSEKQSEERPEEQKVKGSSTTAVDTKTTARRRSTRKGLPEPTEEQAPQPSETEEQSTEVRDAPATESSESETLIVPEPANVVGNLDVDGSRVPENSITESTGEHSGPNKEVAESEAAKEDGNPSKEILSGRIVGEGEGGAMEKDGDGSAGAVDAVEAKVEESPDDRVAAEDSTHTPIPEASPDFQDSEPKSPKKPTETPLVQVQSGGTISRNEQGPRKHSTQGDYPSKAVEASNSLAEGGDASQSRKEPADEPTPTTAEKEHQQPSPEAASKTVKHTENNTKRKMSAIDTADETPMAKKLKAEPEAEASSPSKTSPTGTETTTTAAAKESAPSTAAKKRKAAHDGHDGGAQQQEQQANRRSNKKVRPNGSLSKISTEPDDGDVEISTDMIKAIISPIRTPPEEPVPEAKKAPPKPTSPTKTKTEASSSEPQASPNASQTAPTGTVVIRNFKRPLMLKAVQDLVAKYGEVTNFWMDKIKTHCFVTYADAEQAAEAQKNIHGMVFPSEVGQKLTVEHIESSEADRLISEAESKQTRSRPVVPPPLPPRATQEHDLVTIRGRAGSAGGRPNLFTSALSAALASAPPIASARQQQLHQRSQKQQPQKPSPTSASELPGARKTKAVPHIFYLPLTDAEVAAKKAKSSVVGSTVSSGPAKARRDIHRRCLVVVAEVGLLEEVAPASTGEGGKVLT